MLWMADDVLAWCYSQRTTAIEGNQGSGKTLLAFELARYLLLKEDRELRYLISNVACDFADDITDVVPREGKYLDCVIVFDEIGKFLNKSNIMLANNLVADLRKLNCVLLMPSRNETNKELRQHVIEPAMNFGVFGIDAIYYKAWLDRRSSKNKTSFLFTGTSEIKGHYDSDEVVEDSQGIIPWLLETKKQIALEQGEIKQKKKVVYMS